ncbi:hypothetical protein GOQ29_07780 [Clostridium sp. D2Q-14]|uniref:hypothetical protein n=1 Tax=Anaeromonas gelatinilytica TaxID=2683194 RepID=UPI00193B80C8|nr:hypothetical protein [Anaeromonas gelatinilytica]MBS4535520.1 hypothetical protein [Anaeromonas gelatinilytica]
MLGSIEAGDTKFISLLAGYVEIPNFKNYIVKPLLEGNSGVMGGLVLASREFKK